MTSLHKLIQTTKVFTHLPHNELQEQLEQINSEAGRYYKTPAGLLYPSVTTVTGLLGLEDIKKWRARVGEDEANRISTKATKRGSRVHKLCEAYLNNDLNNIEPDKYTLSDIDNFMTLMPTLDYIDNIRMQETRLYSDYLRVAGTVDCIADFDGKLSVIDFKTATKPKKESYITNYFCQAAAYAIMYEERTGIPINRIVVLISVDYDDPQIFVKKRDQYVEQLFDVRRLYKERYNV